MTISLITLLDSLPDKEVLQVGNPSQPVTAIAYASQEVQPGAAFVAVVGFHTDGHRYLPDAVRRGAALIVGSNRPALLELANHPDYPNLAIVQVPDERAALAHLAACFYGYPARRLGVVGITGTKGKTTTSFLASEVLEAGGYSTGLIGTVDFKVGNRRWANDTRKTTPETVEIQGLMAQMAAEKVDYCVLESSSHGLALRKLLHSYYDVAVLTNITHEHLDFHGTVEQYRYDKGILFESLAEGGIKTSATYPKTAILNADDPAASYFRQRAKTATRAAGIELRVLTFGIEQPADVRAENIGGDANYLTYTVITSQGKINLKLNLPGRFNVYNSLAAFTVGISQGLSLEQARVGLERVAGVPGRMEKIDEGQPFSVIVDYAHNPDSIEQVLKTLRPLTPGKLIALFGSAGERDLAKRAVQGELAAKLADFAIFTNEDPRLEDENAIIAQIAQGAAAQGWREGTNYLNIVDRRRAIETAVAMAAPGDTLLLAGKGHESCVIIGTTKVPWDERDEARRAIRNLKEN